MKTCLLLACGCMLRALVAFGVECLFVFFLLLQTFDAPFNIAHLSLSDAFCSFRRASNICLFCAICTNSFVVFFVFFAFLCPSEHRFLAYVCLCRDILPVSLGFHVFRLLILTFLFCLRAYCERCGGKLR